MANEQNLRPVPITTTEQAKRLGRAGGSVSSPKKKLAARLRELKKKGMTDTDAKRLADIFEFPELSALDIHLFLEKAKGECRSAGQMSMVADKFIQLHKAHHGEKIKSESTNVNVNINIDMMKFNNLAEDYSK